MAPVTAIARAFNCGVSTIDAVPGGSAHWATWKNIDVEVGDASV